MNLTDEPVSQTCTIVAPENLPPKCPSTPHPPSSFPDIGTATVQIANDLDNGDKWASDWDMRNSDWEGNIVPSDSEYDTSMSVDMDSIPDSPQSDIDEEKCENPKEQSPSALSSLPSHSSVLGSRGKVYDMFTRTKRTTDDLEKRVEMKDKPRTLPEKRLIGEVDGAMSSQSSLGESVVNEVAEEEMREKHTRKFPKLESTSKTGTDLNTTAIIGIGPSSIASRVLNESVQHGTFVLNPRKWDNFRAKILRDDKDAEFHNDP